MQTMQTGAGLAGVLSAFLAFTVLLGSCRDAKQSKSQGNSSGFVVESRYSFQAHVSSGNHAFDVFTEGKGSLRTLTLVRTLDGMVDTTRKEIDGAVTNAVCADLDRDSIPEIYVFARSAGSGSFAHLYGFQFDRRATLSIALPELDKRQSAGFLGHDTLWVQDSLIVRRFPVYTEGDFNAFASGGTRTIEYALQRGRDGGSHLFAVRVANSREP